MAAVSWFLIGFGSGMIVGASVVVYAFQKAASEVQRARQHLQ